MRKKERGREKGRHGERGKEGETGREGVVFHLVAGGCSSPLTYICSESAGLTEALLIKALTGRDFSKNSMLAVCSPLCSAWLVVSFTRGIRRTENVFPVTYFRNAGLAIHMISIRNVTVYRTDSCNQDKYKKNGI